MRRLLLWLMVLSLVSGGAAWGLEAAQAADQVKPIEVGAELPDVSVRRPDGLPLKLRELAAEEPLAVIFYRGGWCPYCNAHLGELAQAQSTLDDLGVRVIGISPDRPEKVGQHRRDRRISYQLYSDSTMDAARAFGLAFVVPPETVKLYMEKYNIDIEADSGQTHHQLPVPAAYLVGKGGKIRFAYWNPDYKTRIDIKEFLKEAKALIQE